MGHSARMLLVGRVTYYLGWIALLCGGVMHLMRVYVARGLSQRNLLEFSVACFAVCIASELRARGSAGA